MPQKPPLTDEEKLLWQTENAPLQGLRRPLEGVGDALMTFLGLQEQKEGDLPSAVGAGLGLGVGAIPPKLARELGKRMVSSIKHPEVKRVFKNLQELYPRLMGHVDQVRVGRFDPDPRGVSHGRSSQRIGMIDPDTLTNMFAEDPKATERFLKHSTIGIDPTQYPYVEMPHNPATVAAHELTHVAQNVRDVNFPQRYTSSSLSYGYEKNPYEVSARSSGDKFLKLDTLASKAGLTPKQLRDLNREVRSSPRMREFRPVAPFERDLPDAEYLKALALVDENTSATPSELERQLMSRRKR